MNSKTIRTVVLSALVACTMATQATSARARSVEKVLHRFTGGNDGGGPIGGLIFDSSGNLYGTTANSGLPDGSCPGSCGTVFKLSPSSNGKWTETVLYIFKGGMDGGIPYASLVFDSSGNLYGTASEGGDPRYCSDYQVPGCGVVFELSPTGTGKWKQKVLYSFTGSDGALPDSGLVFDRSGNLYGTTFLGGNTGCVFGGCGVVFELMPSSGGKWSETVLHRFRGGSDGEASYATLILDAAGSLYGTTELGGGDRYCQSDECGIVFELTPTSNGSWKETVIHRFTGGEDGAGPDAGVISDAQGNLYGTAGGGGLPNCQGHGCGVVFELSPRGNGRWEEKVLHAFTGGKDGATPLASLIFDAAGDLNGTTAGGGNGQSCYGGCGVVFKLTPSSSGEWKETVLHAFTGKDGAYPESSPSVTLGPAGNLYGTTIFGGNLKDCQSSQYPGCGAAFRVIPCPASSIVVAP
jgi:uncharacterized repeat protein (TIGR03803 family)